MVSSCPHSLIVNVHCSGGGRINVQFRRVECSPPTGDLVHSCTPHACATKHYSCSASPKQRCSTARRPHPYQHMMPGCPAADLVVLVSNNVGGSANSGTTGNWIKLQITVGRKHLSAPAGPGAHAHASSGKMHLHWHGTRRQVACLYVLRISVLLTY